MHRIRVSMSRAWIVLVFKGYVGNPTMRSMSESPSGFLFCATLRKETENCSGSWWSHRAIYLQNWSRTVVSSEPVVFPLPHCFPLLTPACVLMSLCGSQNPWGWPDMSGLTLEDEPQGCHDYVLRHWGVSGDVGTAQQCPWAGPVQLLPQ